MYAGVVTKKEISFENKQLTIMLFEELCFRISDWILSNYDFYKYSSLAIAAAIVGVARKALGFEEWSLRLE